MLGLLQYELTGLIRKSNIKMVNIRLGRVRDFRTIYGIEVGELLIHNSNY